MYYAAGISGYSQSVLLEDNLILTIAGTAEQDGGWDALIGNSDLTAIRWKPER